MGKIKIGVFGAGRGMTMIRELLRNPDAALVAICDKYEPLLAECRKLADSLGVKIALYRDFDAFFQHDMDAVVLANYANEHATYAVKLLRSGRDILSECLTCATLSEAVALIEAVEETGRFYSFAENCCYFATAWEMRRRYRAGDIGELMQAECEYLHDCSSIWPRITYGERNHWRNRMPSTFYCTHSLGPILFGTGLRPVAVNGFETPNMPFMRNLGWSAGSAGTLIVTLENGAIVKSIDMCLKRQHAINFAMYGDRGMMETDRFEEGLLHTYVESANCVGTWDAYKPPYCNPDAAGSGHNGIDFFPTHYFIRSLCGDEEARKNTVSVYDAVDMCLPGLLGFRSIINGNAKIEIPDLRICAERDKVRNDTFCTFPENAGTMYVPCNAAQKNRDEEIPDAVYEEVRRKWQNGENG